MSANFSKRLWGNPEQVLEEHQERMRPVIEGERMRARREQLEMQRRMRRINDKQGARPKAEPKVTVGATNMSKEKIIADLERVDPDFVRKMRNWVRWSPGVNYAKSKAYEGAQPTSGYAQSTVPVLGGDAGDVNDAMKKLRERERAAVTLFWTYEGRSLSWIGKRLGEGVSYHTAEVRIRNGHEMLRAHLAWMRVQSDKKRQAAEFLGAGH